MEEGKFYLFACPWDWTFVGRFKRHINFCQAVIDYAGYFTRTGATFDLLTTKGFTAETVFHATPGGVEQIISGPFLAWPWRAKTPWAKEIDQ